MNTRTRLAAASTTAALAISLSACGDSTSASGIEEWQDRGYATVAVAQLMPYSSVAVDGTPDGYYPEIVSELLSEAGVDEIRAKATSFDSMIPALQANQVDVIASGFSITEERCSAVLFSNPLTVQNDAIYTMAGAGEFTSVADFAENPDSKLIVLSGSAQEAYATANGVDRERMVGVADSQATVEALKSGRGDGILLGQFSLPDPEDSGLELFVDKSTPLTATAVAFREDDVEARDAFNEQLEKFREDGTLAEIYEKWGFSNGDVLEATTKPSDIAPNCR